MPTFVSIHHAAAARHQLAPVYPDLSRPLIQRKASEHRAASLQTYLFSEAESLMTVQRLADEALQSLT